MGDREEPVRIVLTPEQREAVHRMSGQHVEMIELTPDESDADGKQKGTGPLRFRWRLSAASGIPRQTWAADDDAPPPKSA